jgi:hypothetical protein
VLPRDLDRLRFLSSRHSASLCEVFGVRSHQSTKEEKARKLQEPARQRPQPRAKTSSMTTPSDKLTSFLRAPTHTEIHHQTPKAASEYLLFEVKNNHCKSLFPRVRKSFCDTSVPVKKDCINCVPPKFNGRSAKNPNDANPDVKRVGSPRTLASAIIVFLRHLHHFVSSLRLTKVNTYEKEVFNHPTLPRRIHEAVPQGCRSMK